MEEDGPRVVVSQFDYSVDDYFTTIHTISQLCEQPETDGLDETDIQRFSSSITFLREWKYFNYEPRIIRFANESGTSGEKIVLSEINLPQFSSATVPKKQDATSTESSSKDFVMYVGGSVWALDWCPRVHENPDRSTKCEFIAIAAHPPETYYHKLGAPLTGRGIIQIWGILNVILKEEEISPPKKSHKKKGPNSDDAIEENLRKPRGRPRKRPIVESLGDEAAEDKSSQLKRPRGRPRKKPRDESSENLDVNDQFDLLPACRHPEDSSELLSIQEVCEITQEHAMRKNLRKKPNNSRERVRSSNSGHKAPVRNRRLRSKASEKRYNDDLDLPLLTLIEDEGAPISSPQISHSSGQDSVVCSNVSGSGPLSLASCSVPKDIALPRVMLCLAHNGKVAWDVKWQPYNAKDTKCKQRMGYLAVLLGNGSLEVWEVPLPRTIKAIYSSSVKEGTDPRFVKLKPVFTCSMLKSGGIQSIPLTVEWSTSLPYDYLLAGCHDGTVALWKFCGSGSSEDTRPLLCFSADTVPIRSVAWAPTESDPESINIILTAGHGGLKFWDIRDPFHPLWDLHPVPRFIYDLDWSSDPSCVILSFDDGALRILSLVKTAYDVPATGKPFIGSKHGLHLSNCLSFAIWSVQVSQLTGMVAYCSADGTVLHFQLTKKAVEKDPSRNRAPHFVCGSLTEDNSTITVITPLADTPITLKKVVNDCAERSMRSLATESTPSKSSNNKKGNTGSSVDDRTLAICYGDDPGEESEAPNSGKKSKSKNNSRKPVTKKANNDKALVCIDEDATNVEGKENGKGETGNEMEFFPPKMAAMHRLRWNMNKGSERWLCYGGAAGIVRCQEIRVPMPDVDKKRYKRT